MKLLVENVLDYLVQKIRTASSVCGVLENLELQTVSDEELLALEPSGTPKSVALQTDSGAVITHHLEILKYLSDLVPSSCLRGKKPEEVDMWLEKSWHDLGNNLISHSFFSTHISMYLYIYILRIFFVCVQSPSSLTMSDLFFFFFYSLIFYFLNIYLHRGATTIAYGFIIIFWWKQ